MNSRFLKGCLLLFIMGIFLIYGCTEDDTVTGGNGNGTEAGLDSAFQELASLMETMIDTMAENENARPADFDFSGLHQIFTDYLNAHPNDPAASFGCAMTSILTLSASEDIDVLIDTIAAVDDWWFFKGYVPNPAKFSGRGEMLRFPTEITSSGIESNFLAQSYFAVMAKAMADPPQFSEIQDVVREEFIPAVDAAIGYFDNILASPGYVFWVTPEMTGETESDSVEIDRADFLVFAAGLNVIKSFFHIVVTYDVDLPSYDSAGIVYMLDQDSNWMSLYADGASHMATAKTAFLDAVDLVDNALNALETEQSTDLNQSNDLIKADWSSSEYDNAHDIVDSVEGYMAIPQWVYADFNNDGFEDSVRVDAAVMFDNPIDGIFSLLPPYTAEVNQADETIIIVTITWEANSFGEWVIPDPGVNGILPDINTDAKFKELFGLTEDSWSKQEELRMHF